MRTALWLSTLGCAVGTTLAVGWVSQGQAQEQPADSGDSRRTVQYFSRSGTESATAAAPGSDVGTSGVARPDYYRQLFGKDRPTDAASGTASAATTAGGSNSVITPRGFQPMDGQDWQANPAGIQTANFDSRIATPGVVTTGGQAEGFVPRLGAPASTPEQAGTFRFQPLPTTLGTPQSTPFETQPVPVTTGMLVNPFGDSALATPTVAGIPTAPIAQPAPFSPAAVVSQPSPSGTPFQTANLPTEVTVPGQSPFWGTTGGAPVTTQVFGGQSVAPQVADVPASNPFSAPVLAPGLNAGPSTVVSPPANPFGASADAFRPTSPWLTSPATAPATVPTPTPVAAPLMTQRSINAQPVSAVVPTPVIIAAAAAAEPAIDSAKALVQTRWVRKGEMNVGQECSCDLIVENMGKVDVANVEVTAVFPPAVRLTDANPIPEISNTQLNWRFESLAPGEQQIIAITMIPSQTGDIEATANVRFTAAAQTVFAIRQPMLKLEIAGISEVLLGDPAPHQVTVTNPGTGIAKNVQIEAAIPAGIEHAKGERLVMDIGSLNPGESRTIRLALSATAGGDHVIQVAARGDAGLQEAATSLVRVVSPALETRIDGPPLRFKGRTAEFDISVSNTGTVPTSNVRLMHKIPEGLKYISADHGATYDSSTQIVSWFVGRLGGGEKAAMKVTLEAVELGDYTHFVRATSEQGARADAQLGMKVAGIASLALEITDSEDPIEVGSETIYTIKIGNQGSLAANNVTVRCELPKGLEILSAEGPTEYLSELDSLVFRPLASVGPGETTYFKVKVRAGRAGSVRFRVQLSSDSTTDPISDEELTRFYGE